MAEGITQTSNTAYAPVAASQIRILVLDPSDESTRLLSGTFECPNQDQPHSEPYEALSYAWGTDLPTETIIVNGAAIRITKTLKDILTSLRSSTEPRRLWIDAICIDQRNECEKSSQVARMAQVYRQAAQVLAWVGGSEVDEVSETVDRLGDFAPEFGFKKDIDQLVQLTKQDNGFAIYGMSDGNTDAIQRVRWGEDFLCVNELPLEIYPLREVRQMASAVASSRSDFIGTASAPCLLAVFASSWFTRVWIVQEAVSAERLVLCHGGQQIPWKRFATAVYLISLMEHESLSAIKSSEGYIQALDVVTLRFARQLYGHPRTMEAGELEITGEPNTIASPRAGHWTRLQFNSMLQHIQEGIPFRHEVMRTGDYSPIATIMRSMRRRDCRDDRDRLFGALGIFPTDLQVKLQPDYSKSAKDVYVQWAREMLSVKRVDMLNDAGMYSRIDQIYNPLDSGLLPSWVPEYRKAKLRCRDKLRWFKPEMNRLWDLCTPQLRLDDEPGCEHRLHIQTVSVGEIDFAVDLKNRPLGALSPVVSTMTQVMITQEARRRGGRSAEAAAGSHAQTVLNMFDGFVNSRDDLGIERIGDSEAVQDGTSMKIDVALIFSKGYSATSIPDSAAWSSYTFFVTAQGNVGFAPTSLLKGSKIVAFVGLPSPYVVSRVATTSEWRLIGPCYVEGMMRDYEFGDDYHFLTLV